MTDHRVFLIFGEFAGDLWSLSRRHHVWLMNSPANDEQAKQVWQRETEPYCPERGVTTFRSDGCSTTDVYRMLATVDGHHDKYSANPPWAAIHVRGVAVDEITADAVGDDVGDRVTVTPEPGGFVIHRMPAMQTVVAIDTAAISDWNSFHSVCASTFGFPSFYGRNMNAWIDCMESIDEPNDGMTSVHAPKGGVFVLALSDATDRAARCPTIFAALVDAVAFVNHSRLGIGEPAVLALSYHREPPER